MNQSSSTTTTTTTPHDDGGGDGHHGSEFPPPSNPAFFFTFCIVCVAAYVIGRKMRQWFEFPLVTGYLITGILCGPHILQMMTEETVSHLDFVFDVCLAYIAFSAGAEIYIPEIKPLIGGIAKISIAQTILFLILGVVSTFFFAEQTTFLRDLDDKQKIGVSLMTSVIMIARSPSSAIAIINELGAKGPFIQTVLGVTIVSDIVVLITFAVSFGITRVFFDSDATLSGEFVAILLGEIFLSFIIGFSLSFVLKWILRMTGDGLYGLVKRHSNYILHHWWHPYLRGRAPLFRGILMIGVGFLVFYVGELSHIHLDLALETLLTCLTAGVFVVNAKKKKIGPHRYINYRHRMHVALDVIGAIVYVAFFTLIGLGLNIAIVPAVIDVAVYFFVVRFVIMYISCYIGGRWNGSPSIHNHTSAFTYVTQAGVALALTESINQQFPEFGEDYATTIIAVIVIGQILGPMMFKWAVRKVGEAGTNEALSAHGDGPAPQFSLHVWWWKGEDEENALAARRAEGGGEEGGEDVTVATHATSTSNLVQRRVNGQQVEVFIDETEIAEEDETVIDNGKDVLVTSPIS